MNKCIRDNTFYYYVEISEVFKDDIPKYISDLILYPINKVHHISDDSIEIVYRNWITGNESLTLKIGDLLIREVYDVYSDKNGEYTPLTKVCKKENFTSLYEVINE